MMVNFSNHPSGMWSKEQLNIAQQYGDIIDIRFPQVDSDASEADIKQIADTYIDKILSHNPDVVMCQGEFTLCYSIVKRLKDKNIKCVAACSARETKDELLDNGTLKKVTLFNFCRFREYE